MILAVTNSDETNMLACQVAYTLFHTPTKIARVRAYETAGEALRLDPNNARAHVTLSLLQLTDGAFDAAVTSARQAVAKDPGNAELQVNLALTLAFSGMLEEADAVLQAVRQHLSVCPHCREEFDALGRGLDEPGSTSA